MARLDFILVDGYNVINSWESLIELKNNSFEHARDKLVDMLCEFVSFSGTKVMVVFDAHLKIGGFERHENHKGVDVVYTKEGEIADCYIERKVVSLSKKWDVGVVTSDALEQRIAFQMGAIRITPREFLEDIKNTENRIKGRTNLSYTDTKNLVENCIEKDIFEKLERMRRNL